MTTPRRRRCKPCAGTGLACDYCKQPFMDCECPAIHADLDGECPHCHGIGYLTPPKPIA